MTTAYSGSFLDCIVWLNELIALIGEDEHDISTCLKGAPLRDYREITGRETKALEDIKRSLRRGC